MGMYCTTNRCLPIMLFFSQCKINPSVKKFKGIQSVRYQYDSIRRAQFSTKGNSATENNGYRKSQSMGHESVFMSKILTGKLTAGRSLLVHATRSQYAALYNYCSKLGTVANMWPYRTIQGWDLVLVEYKNKESLHHVMDMVVPDRFCKKIPEVFFVHKRKTSMNSLQAMPESLRSKKFLDLVPVGDKMLLETFRQGQTVSEQIKLVYEKLKLTETEVKLRFFVLKQLETALAALHPHVTVLPFGSFVNGMGKRYSDLDLVAVHNTIPQQNSESNINTHHFKVPGKKKSRMLGTEEQEYLRIISLILPYVVPSIYEVFRILGAKVPIIKFRHEYADIQCDLSCNEGSGVYMSELLFLMGALDHRLRPINMIIREWARSRRLTNERAGHWLTNFSISLLVIFYFQTMKLLPSVNTLKSYATAKDIQNTGGLDVTFLRNPDRLPRKYLEGNFATMEDLLYGFFEYYSRFDFHKLSICLRKGVPQINTLAAPLFIRNPFDENLNVSKNVSVTEIGRFKQHVEEALFIMSTNGSSTNTTLEQLLNIRRNDTKIRSETDDSTHTVQAANADIC